MPKKNMKKAKDFMIQYCLSLTYSYLFTPYSHKEKGYESHAVKHGTAPHNGINRRRRRADHKAREADIIIFTRTASGIAGDVFVPTDQMTERLDAILSYVNKFTEPHRSIFRARNP